VSAATSEPVIEKVNNINLFFRTFGDHEVQGRLEGREALRPLSRFALFYRAESLVLRVIPARRDGPLFLVVVHIRIEADHDERPVANVGEQLHHPLVLTGINVRVVLVLVNLGDDYVLSEVHQDIGAAPRAPICDGTVKRDREVGVLGFDIIGHCTLFCSVQAHDRVVGEQIDEAAVAVPLVCFVPDQHGAVWSFAERTANV